ncbi:MAG: hypothetical protein FWG27_08955 [Treponema sp.]|nr:hypothetical protein [Treponema sp.]
MKKLIIAGMAALFVSACSSETAMQRLLGTSASSPVFYGCKTPAEGEVNFFFSREVQVMSLYFDPPMETDIHSQGETVAVCFASDLPGGSKVTADILVEDKERNTLNVLVSFRTRNNRMPDLAINEIRAAYSKPRVEFVEFIAQSAGNLGALRVFAAYEQEDPIFEFPPVEVKKGEYIVLHTRSIEPGIADETGTNLALSKGTDALPTARDFWIPGSLKLHDTNAIYIMDQDNRIIDGVLLLSGNYKWKDSITAAAREMARQGVWFGPESVDAVITDGNTATRTICRDEDRNNSHSAADWYVTVTSGATPGQKNNPGRYRP